MIQPIRDLVYIIPLEDKNKIGSLYVPETAKQRVDQGIVKYRGPLSKHVKRGDHVIFSGYDGSQIVTEDDGLLYVMPEEFILACLVDGRAYVFSEGQIESLIADALGKASVRYSGDAQGTQAIKYLAEVLRSEVQDHFFSSLSF